MSEQDPLIVAHFATLQPSRKSETFEDYERRALANLPYTGEVWIANRRANEAYWARAHAEHHAPGAPDTLQTPQEGSQGAVLASKAPETPEEAFVRLSRRERTLQQRIKRAWARSRKAWDRSVKQPRNPQLVQRAEMLTGRAESTEIEDREELTRIGEQLAGLPSVARDQQDTLAILIEKELTEAFEAQKRAHKPMTPSRRNPDNWKLLIPSKSRKESS